MEFFFLWWDVLNTPHFTIVKQSMSILYIEYQQLWTMMLDFQQFCTYLLESTLFFSDFMFFVWYVDIFSSCVKINSTGQLTWNVSGYLRPLHCRNNHSRCTCSWTWNANLLVCLTNNVCEGYQFISDMRALRDLLGWWYHAELGNYIIHLKACWLLYIRI